MDNKHTETSQFLSAFKSHMAQITELFAHELEKELKKSHIAAEEYIEQKCGSFHVKISNMEQKLDQMEKTIKDQNEVISRLQESQKRTMEERNYNSEAKRAKVDSRPTLNRDTGKNPLAGVERPTVLLDPGIEQLRSSFAAQQPVSQPRMSSSGSKVGATSGKYPARASSSVPLNLKLQEILAIPGVQDRCSEANTSNKRQTFTLDEKYHAIVDVEGYVYRGFEEGVAIRKVVDDPKFNHVGEKTLRSWWEERTRIKTLYIDRPEDRSKKSVRKSNISAPSIAPSGVGSDWQITVIKK